MVGPLFADDGPKDGTTITSARKEIGYDAASGRFFETDIDPEDCIPEDEYCVVDKATGELVRLTLEEKERIFLDALQVSCAVIGKREQTNICLVGGPWFQYVFNQHRFVKLYISKSYYVSGRQLLNDAEFDLLKEDLAWNGSAMVNMNRQETKYLASVQAYLKGKPILSDAEFDQLKSELKEQGSQFASSKEPKCYIGT